MKPGDATPWTTALALLSAQAALAHPGHVHGPGPVHGFSWVDLALFLAASAVVPAVALLLARRRYRRR